MVVDFEAAWHELHALIAGKSQHGREATLIAMAEIAERHQVAGGELSRLLRLYGVEVERARSITADIDRDESGPFAGGDASPVDSGLPGHHDLGGHDGGSNGRAAAGLAGS